MMTKKTAFTLIVGASFFLGGTTVVTATELAEKCVRCHGENGNSEKPEVPSIAGFSSSYFVDTMNAYKGGDRTAKKLADEDEPNDMQAITEGLSEEDIKALGDYFAEQTFVPREQEVDSKLAKKGKKIYRKRCKRCHADNGSDPDDDAGILAGQWKPYLQAQLEAFKEGKRTTQPKKMQKQIDKLEEGDIEKLVNFFAKQQ
jgi:sulfide dehydrogenase cytochrome subunit